MTSASIDAGELESHVSAVIAALAPAEQAKLSRQIGQYLQTKTQQDLSAQRTPDGQSWAARKQIKGRPRNRRKMFVRMRLSKHLAIRAKPGQVIVGWQGPVARVANIHQRGLKDPNNHNTQYTARVLIDLTEQDKSHISDIVTGFIQP